MYLVPLPAVAETAHPVPDVEEKRLALLLASVADIDTGLDLLIDIPARTSKDLGGPSSHTMSKIFVPSNELNRGDALHCLRLLSYPRPSGVIKPIPAPTFFKRALKWIWGNCLQST